MKILKNKIISGAFFLSIGVFISKILGAFYRVLLTHTLGAKGLGVYQMVFPVYALLLDLSGAGLPNGLARVFSKQENKEREGIYLYSALKFFTFIGLIFTLVMVIISKPLSILQANAQGALSYITLAPAVFIVALSCVYRGYFQGKINTKPIMQTQIFSQLIKIVLGVGLCYAFRNNITLSVACATFAITLSETFSYIYLRAKAGKTLIVKQYDKTFIKGLLKSLFPITILGLILPFSQVIDGILTVNILKNYLDNATALYGILSGVVLTIIGLPVGVCHTLASVAVPALSSEQDNQKKYKRASDLLLLTLLVSIPCAFLCYYFAPSVISLIFSNLSVSDKLIAVGLLKLTSFAIVFLSVLQTSNAILIGMNMVIAPILSTLFGCIVKVILSFYLLKDARLNIYGGGIALIACYFCACLVNLIVIVAKENGYAYKTSTNRRQNA